MRRFALVAVSLVIAGSAWGQTYRWVDPATGKTMYTDTPPPRTVKNVSQTGKDGAGGGAELGYAAKRAAENFPVTLYSAPDCAEECKQARDLLNKRGVPFTEKSVQQPKDVEELKALVGAATVPALKVGRQSLKGFQADEYNNLLDLAGYPTFAPYGAKPAPAPASPSGTAAPEKAK